MWRDAAIEEARRLASADIPVEDAELLAPLHLALDCQRYVDVLTAADIPSV